MSTEGKETLKKEIKEIAKSVLNPAESASRLVTEEARACIDETVAMAQESTIASRLKAVFPIANPTGEVTVNIDPSKLTVNEGPQHKLLTTILIDDIIQMFDPKNKKNIPWDDGRLDYEDRVAQNFDGLQKNWNAVRDSSAELSRVSNNPVTDLLINQNGKDECLYRLGRVDDVQHWKIPGGSLGQGSIRIKVTLTITKTMKVTQVGKVTVGDLYFSMLDHPNGRGPGFLVIPAGASAGRVQFGAIELTRIIIDKQPEAFRDNKSEAMIKNSLT